MTNELDKILNNLVGAPQHRKAGVIIDAKQAINAYILGEVMELVGYDTQTMHDDNGISDFANMDIDIAITDLINWVNNGGKIDIHEKNRLKNRIIERVHGSRQEHGANQLRQELRNKANKKWGKL